MIGMGGKAARFSASDKTEIIRLVEQSPWPARRTLEKLGIPKSSFYRWYDRCGPEVLADRAALDDPGFGTGSRRLSAVRLSTWLWINPNSVLRELAVRFTDEEKYFVSELVLSASKSARSHHQPSTSSSSGRGVPEQDHSLIALAD